MISRNANGFTLIEVLIAMAIVAVGILATSRAVSTQIDVAQRTEDKVLGTWVASNQMATYRIGNRYGTPSPGSSSEQVKMAGRTWLVNRRISPAGIPDAVRIDVEVFADLQGDNKIATVSSYLVTQAPPAEANATPAPVDPQANPN